MLSVEELAHSSLANLYSSTKESMMNTDFYHLSSVVMTELKNKNTCMTIKILRENFGKNLKLVTTDSSSCVISI